MRLRRGVTVFARDEQLLQVGVDPDRRVVLPNTPASEQLLARLAQGVTGPLDPETAEVVSALRAAGLLVDQQRLEQAAARSRTRIRLLGPAQWRQDLTAALIGEGLTGVGTSAERAAERPAERSAESPDRYEVTVLLSAGEPDRAWVDALTHPGDAVLLVAAVDSRIRVGPFVLPGVTACLRCVDHHLAGVDPRYPLALAAAQRDYAVELPALQLQAALVLTAGQVLAWAEQRPPSTWSATTWIEPDLGTAHRTWPRHPHCGCCWGDALRVG